MAKPDKTERFKVTEREAGTGRVVHEMQGDAPVLLAASPSDGAKLEGFEGPVNPLAVDPHIPATSVPATAEFLPSRFCRRVCRLLERHRQRPHR